MLEIPISETRTIALPLCVVIPGLNTIIGMQKCNTITSVRLEILMSKNPTKLFVRHRSEVLRLRGTGTWKQYLALQALQAQ